MVDELQTKYESVTSYIIKIEEIIEGTMTGASESMAEYYNYWERRIFNAISTMLIRGTAGSSPGPWRLPREGNLSAFYTLGNQRHLNRGD